MDDPSAAATSEASVRRSKRNRVNKVNLAENQEDSRTDPTDRSPDGDEEEIDEFEEVRPKAKRNRAPSDRTTEGIAELSLIEAVRGSRKNIQQVAKLWVERYEKDPKPAMLDLLSMLFESCGAKYHIDGDPFEEIDVDTVVLALVTLARKGEVEDPQSSKRKDFNHFRDNLVYFWDCLVNECQNGPLFDGVLLDKCTDYVIALSCTPPRVFRQIASLVGLQLVTSFITIAKMLGSQRETTQRQLNAENKKRADGPKVESLSKRLSTTHDQITTIEEMMDKIFKGLFMHRYRDIDPNIRMSCVQSLGTWILSYPSLFLQDRYLKYLGWTLNDKSAGVRKASILALQSLYEVDDNIPNLDLFTQRFSGRMIELADDIDVSVAVCAIGLVKQLLRHQLLLDDHLGSLYDLLVVESPEIRRAIGELVYDHLIAQKFNSSQSHSKADSESSLVTLSRMLQILREFSTDPILITYVIDDVWEYMKAMKDWKCIISMLLDENPSVELTESDATNLIRLLCASVTKAVGERIVPATDNKKQYYTKAQKEVSENNKRDITVVMMKNYPQLLRKYVLDKAKAPSLIEIILHMNLELYSLKRQEENFKIVLNHIREAFFKLGDKDTLRSCVKAMDFCTKESRGELRDFVSNKLKELEDELVAKLKIAMKEVADGDDEYPLLVNLKRLYELQLSRSVPIDSLFEEFASMLQNFRTINDEMNSFLLLNMHLHIKWSLHSVLNSESVLETTVTSLLSKRDTLLKLLESFLPTSDNEEGIVLGHELACRVCVILVELWSLFQKSKFSSTAVGVLGIHPEQSSLERFWRLCEQQLDISNETEDADANREYVEEATRESIMFEASRLVATDIVPTEFLAPEIISHFAKHGANIGEMVKQLIAVLKKKDGNIFNMYLEALKRAYYRYIQKRSNSGDEAAIKKSLLECKDLAVHLSATFVGFARTNHRLDILKLVEDGIDFAFEDIPNQLSFLECAVLPFALKLPATDVADMLKNVEGRTENVNMNDNPSGWRPYHVFVSALQEKYMKNEALAGAADEKEGTSVRRRGRPSKQHKLHGKRLFDEQSESEDEDMLSASDQEGDPDEDKQDKEDEEDTTLINVIKSSKLRSRTASKLSGLTS